MGAEVNIRILEANAQAQKQVVENINQQIRLQAALLAANQESVAEAVRDLASSEQQQGLFDTVKRIFDPIGITGGADTGMVDAAQAMVDYEKETLDRAERERARLVSQQEIAITALQAAVDKLSRAVKEHYDRVAEIDRLRVHVKDNILYYMQAIWRQEPPDQRFFRIYDLDVPIVEAAADETIEVTFPAPGAADRPEHRGRPPRDGDRLGVVAGAAGHPDEEEAVRGRRPGQRVGLQGQLHGVPVEVQQLRDAPDDAGLPRGRRRAHRPGSR